MMELKTRQHLPHFSLSQTASISTRKFLFARSENLFIFIRFIWEKKLGQQVEERRGAK